MGEQLQSREVRDVEQLKTLAHPMASGSCASSGMSDLARSDSKQSDHAVVVGPGHRSVAPMRSPRST
jgi:hypothetical protein